MSIRTAGQLWILFQVLMAVTALTSCFDSGSTITIQLTNGTEQAVDVTFFEIWEPAEEPRSERKRLETTVAPGEMKEVRMDISIGARLGVVRAVSDGRLVFCQEYDIRGGAARYHTYSIEIVDSQIAPGC